MDDLEDKLKMIKMRCDELNLMVKYHKTINAITEYEKSILYKKRVCDKARNKKEYLNEYQRKVRKEKPNPTIICDICGGKYQKYTYGQHIKFNKHKKALLNNNIEKLEDNLINVEELENYINDLKA